MDVEKKTPCIVGKQNWGFFACQERRHHVFIDDQIASLHLKKGQFPTISGHDPFGGSPRQEEQDLSEALRASRAAFQAEPKEPAKFMIWATLW